MRVLSIKKYIFQIYIRWGVIVLQSFWAGSKVVVLVCLCVYVVRTMYICLFVFMCICIYYVCTGF